MHCAVMSARERPFPDITDQQGLATVGQLLEAGYTVSAIQWARRTVWQEPMPRVIAPHQGPLHTDTWLAASGLWAGSHAVLSGARVLALLGVKFKWRSAMTYVVSDRARARAYRHVALVRSAREPEISKSWGLIRGMKAARALVDAAVYEGYAPIDLEHLAIAILQQGLADPDELGRELWMRPMAKVESVFKGLDAFVKGAWSVPEAVLRELIESDGGFPEFTANCRLISPNGELLGTPDGYFEEAGVAVQVHSKQFHSCQDDAGRDRWSDTVNRDSDMITTGVVVLPVTPADLYRRPAYVLDKLRKAVEVGLRTPAPRVRVVK